MFTALFLTHLILPVEASEAVDEFTEYTFPLMIAILGPGAEIFRSTSDSDRRRSTKIYTEWDRCSA